MGSMFRQSKLTAVGSVVKPAKDKENSPSGIPAVRRRPLKGTSSLPVGLEDLCALPEADLLHVLNQGTAQKGVLPPAP